MKEKNIKVNDFITIKDIPKTDPNCEGRVIEVTNDGVFISNMNMPFMGSFSNEFIPFEKIK